MFSRPLKIYLSGVAGSGVSAIASFLADKGFTVTGSDRIFDIDSNHPLRKILQSKGIAIVPQDGNGMDKTYDFAVFSTAVEHEHPEFLKAKTLGIPIKTRPVFLAEITASCLTIAVSGTSGKSTASGLLAFMMNRLGLNPNFIGGGRVKQFKTSVNPGNSLAGNSDYLVIEACESDGSIVNYEPQHAIILNLSLDHNPVSKTAQMFEAFIKNTREKVVVNADDKNLKKLIERPMITFSVHASSKYKADNIRYKPFSTDFLLNGISFCLSLPGEHNLVNALSCIAMLAEIGVPLDAIASVLPVFQGVDRRFDVHLNDGKRLVIDDYAHNPHKIFCLMQTVKQLRERICYIFQPHGFGPTRLMKNGYIDVFVRNLRANDRLILLPIFYAGGTASKDISSHDIAEGIREAGKSVEVIEARKDIIKIIHEYDSYVVFGARDETLADFAREIALAMTPKANLKKG